ncbi:ribonucleoside-diphosphate reductase NrdZ [bacterium BMS3Abin07]|nr:ribonucleoside-diphosphate reductase NrdZ [bacterium BMS3Abin07]GBE32999.1 ribonucleoside-diphosphate reductase NrdZ [bacterium BMS3Bbin05]HDL20015.1 adenosylcobalamin-dependent ribonucleoside-diphosphate reductase [Nitrospirota bacterium]HDO22864.1 adenosylcobalamin-dependent ribonucleoside-diphosphate reductase [Nitrospirota bacterium]HDZ87415.1 adenosylcobalamin-dependent ribonucleoside-diphosphate reductase [Nitrospirota bacterium]
MLKFTPNALKILKARYLLKDDDGRVIETPAEMFRRVSRTVAEAERLYDENVLFWEDKFYELLSSLRFLPNSPTLMNAGKEIGQLAACFVLPVEDSMKGIFDTLKNAALILQSGGGTGFSFSRLRPKEDVVHSTGGLSSGPVSFMSIYNRATDVIRQGGARRGANMGILRVDHPDIVEFARSKRDCYELSNFNISVAVTDEFMNALKKDEKYELRNPRTGKSAGFIRAADVFNEIVESAWLTGDPGLVFIDRINRDNPTPQFGEIESTNPCGEQPLLPYEACILGSLNLSIYVGNSVLESDAGSPYVNFDALGNDVRTAVRFLDDCIDVNKYPLQDIEQMHKGNRKIGLGVMGWADMLVLMGIPYVSKKALKLAEDVMKFINTTSKDESEHLGQLKGLFPNFYGSVYDRDDMPRVRNATTTTVAPTGTLSTIADCSSGIEPYFALSYRRYVLETELHEVNRYFFSVAKMMGFYSKDLEDEVISNGTLRGIKNVPRKIKKLFKTAHEINYRIHIEMQAVFQKYTDNAVSKTINMPRSAKKEDIADAFMMAYEKGCKGITVFRYGGKKAGTMVRFSDVD